VEIDTNSKRQLENRVDRRETCRDGEEGVEDQERIFGAFLVHIILDDYLHADSHVMERRDDEQQHDDCHQGRAKNLGNRGVIAPDQRNDDQHCRDGQRNIGDRGQSLLDEVFGSGFSRAVAAHAAERRTRWSRIHAAILITAVPPSDSRRRSTK
jgi:hypothetical protein